MCIGGDGTLTTLDAGAGAVLEQRGGEGGPAFIAVSPDGALAVSRDPNNVLRIWNLPAGVPGPELPGHAARVVNAAFSVTGTLLASLDEEGSLRAWDTHTGDGIWGPERVGGGRLAFDNAGHRLAHLSPKGEMTIRDAQTGAPITLFAGGREGPLALSFMPNDSGLLIAGSDKSIRLCDAESGECARELRGHWLRVTAAAVSPDGRWIVSGSDDWTVRLWDLQAPQPTTIVRPGEKTVLALAFSASGEQVFFAAARGIGVLSTAVPDSIHLLREGPIGRKVAFARGGQSAMVPNEDGTVRVLDLSANAADRIVSPGHEGAVIVVELSPDSQANIAASGGMDCTARLWDTQTGQCLQVLTGHTAPVGSLAFSSDGRLLATGSCDKTVKVWRTADGQLLDTLHGYPASVLALAFSSDGRRIVAGGANPQPDQPQAEASTRPEDPQPVHWHGGNCPLVVWDWPSGRHLLTLRGHEMDIYAIVFSPDGRRIVSGAADGLVSVWDAQTGDRMLTLRGHGEGDLRDRAICFVGFTPDGKDIISSGHDGTIRIWRAAEPDTPRGE